jgi:hypothetical protein
MKWKWFGFEWKKSEVQELEPERKYIPREHVKKVYELWDGAAVSAVGKYKFWKFIYDIFDMSIEDAASDEFGWRFFGNNILNPYIQRK